MKPNATLTAAQDKALARIRAEYASRYTGEWGVHVGRGSADAVSYPTLLALESKGRIEIRRHKYDCERLIKGYFGRGIYGTKHWTQIELEVRPAQPEKE